MPARPLLEPAELDRALREELAGWNGTTAGITKTFKLPTFRDSIAFVNHIADVAEDLNHHPDLRIHWNKVTVDIWNWEAGGVTDACITLAKQIDRSQYRAS
jgi:4a-hydroxytetrahydrobiopterin dehydratase